MNETLVHFLDNTATWYALALIIFIVVAVVFARRPIVGMLDAEIAKVRQELDQAQKLRVEAEETVAEYARRQQSAMEEAEAIVAQAKEDAARLRATAEAELKKTLQQREQRALDRIRSAEEEALDEVRAAFVDQAVAAVREQLGKRMDAKLADKLADQAIAAVPSLAKAKKVS